MAECVAVKSETTFTLTLSEVEAQYVEAALSETNPTRFRGDRVWEALNVAMQDAGVELDRNAV